MITLAPAHTRAAELAVRQPGGFAWWCLDLVDEQGDGLVLTWSFGHPFLPGSRRHAGPALARPALSLSIHRGGREIFQICQELPPDEVDWRPESGYGLFGRSLISLQREPDHAGLQIALDLEVPLSARLQGKIRVNGPIRVGGDDAVSDGVGQVWAPLLTDAPGQVRLDGSMRIVMEGKASLDHRVGHSPLHALAVSRWSWGRLGLPGRAVFWSHLDGAGGAEASVRVLEILEDGRARSWDSPIALGPARRGLFGPRVPSTITFQDPQGRVVEVRSRVPMGGSSFHRRVLVDGSCGDEQGTGFTEIVAPSRLDRLWTRPLARMRVHRPGGRNSLWLPFFVGVVEGRMKRLFRSPLRLLTGGEPG